MPEPQMPVAGRSPMVVNAVMAPRPRAVDPHPVDGARVRHASRTAAPPPPARARWPWSSRRARRRPREEDLGVRADVHGEADPRLRSMPCAQGHGHEVRPDEAAHQGRHVDVSAGADVDAEVARLDRHRRAHRGHERGADEVDARAGRGRDGACRCCPPPPSPRCPSACSRARRVACAASRFSALASTRCSFAPLPGASAPHARRVMMSAP